MKQERKEKQINFVKKNNILFYVNVHFQRHDIEVPRLNITLEKCHIQGAA